MEEDEQIAREEIERLLGMAIQVVEFSSGSKKLERCLPRNQDTIGF
jgi:hypothetical protein